MSRKALVFVVALVCCSLFPFEAHAVSALDFKPGRIIDDRIFTNKDSMTIDQIQQFLNAKVSSCDAWGNKAYAGTTRAAYSRSKGQLVPFTCLKDYFENPSTHENNLTKTDGKQAPIPAGAQSAAQIIYNTAQAYNVNPQVLIVMLEKEEALIQDDWPWYIQYRSALGYGCPDTAACDSQYYGFANQLQNAARQFISYSKYPYEYNYISGVNNYVRWSPNSSCGGSNVYIENQATASLYNYTPYQPNAAALNAGYGGGDNCSAYGNRNFFLYFNDWFGSTWGVPYATSEIARSANYSHPLGFTKTVTYKYQNTGASTWYDDVYRPTGQGAIHLAVTAPINKNSPFASNWPSANRPAKTFSKVYESNGTTLAGDQHKAAPGQIVQFTFEVFVPESYTQGTYRLDVQPIVEGTSSWNMGGIASTDITTVPSYKSSWSECPLFPLNIKQNEFGTLTIRFHNDGLSDWYDTYYRGGSEAGAVQLATGGPLDRSSSFAYRWPTANRPAKQFTKVFEADGKTLAADQHKVTPGQVGEYTLTFYANDLNIGPGTYKEEMKIVQNGMAVWDMLGSCAPTIIVEPASYNAQYLYQSPNPVLSKGESSTIFVAYKNIGTGTWYDTTYRPDGIAATYLASDIPINHNSPFATSVWPTANRPAKQFTKVFEADGKTLAADQHKVTPGQVAYYSFPVTNSSVEAGQRKSDGVAIILEGTHAWRMSSQYVWYDIIGK